MIMLMIVLMMLITHCLSRNKNRSNYPLIVIIIITMIVFHSPHFASVGLMISSEFLPNSLNDLAIAIYK